MTRKETVSGIAPQDLRLFFDLLEVNTGIAMDASKEYLLHSRLGTLARAQGLNSVRDLVGKLLQTPLGCLHQQAFDLMATHETLFFRDQLAFDFIKNELMPTLLKKNVEERKLNIWCAAASTGQEPYSLVMLIHEEFPLLQGWEISIHATDMSENCLAQARSGIYSADEVVRGLSTEQIKRHFDLLETGQYRIHSKMKNYIKFYRLNLLDDWPERPLFDLILLRNTLIYFKSERKTVILKRIFSQLARKTGYLMLGSAEAILFDESVETHRSHRVTYYRKAVTSS